MPLSLPDDLTYGTVVGQFIASVNDSPNDADFSPDLAALAGTITFTPSAQYLKYVQGGRSITILKTPITGVLDSEGFLCTDQIDPATGTLRRGVSLVANDNLALNPVGWNWTVSYNLRWQGASVVAPRSHAIDVGTGKIADLTEESPVTPSAGTPIVRGIPGPEGPRGPAGPAATVSLSNVPAGYTHTRVKSSAGVWPARGTSRTDITVIWIGADPSPAIVTTGTTGMYEGDVRLVTG